ncbi:MAG: fructosamine kinase [Gammaproteobacteria bacterium]|nr:MAG: fructosamine kinase [Gammaproteobacteria bacterium]TND03987.1 MAG: fructosamine kinase [Gammaproteobacteria bacterium]
MWNVISDRISEATGRRFSAQHPTPIGGGCINAAYRLEQGERRYFVKTNTADKVSMFAAESAGLQEIARSKTIRVPLPACHGTTGDTAFLVLEHIEFGKGGPGGVAELGRQLARMHRTTSDTYGWRMDNTIGSTRQPNTPSNQWAGFWREQRLGFQLQLAAHNGYGGNLQRKGERLLADIDRFFVNHEPAASLLHGDLWAGNYGITPDGTPVIFDPAVYYGDRETDMAMTELFGGYPAAFYETYEDEYPLNRGYGVRKTLYNLYHVLNHLNLFGGGYLSQAEHMMDTLLY